MLTKEEAMVFREWAIYSFGLYRGEDSEAKLGTGTHTSGFMQNRRGRAVREWSLGNSDHSPIQGLCTLKPFGGKHKAVPKREEKKWLVSSEASTLLLSSILSTSGVPAVVVWMRMAPQPPVFEYFIPSWGNSLLGVWWRDGLWGFKSRHHS